MLLKTSSTLHIYMDCFMFCVRFQLSKRARPWLKLLGFLIRFVDEAIDFLLKIEVLKAVKNQIVPGEQHVHLKAKSKNIWRHHTNWRMATIQNFNLAAPMDLHYSLAFSCSLHDARKLRDSILRGLKEMSEVIGPSTPESAYVYCFDFFKWPND
ncbi:MAG: hypothetical protein V9E84_05755 [Trichococcus flocculiformis]